MVGCTGYMPAIRKINVREAVWSLTLVDQLVSSQGPTKNSSDLAFITDPYTFNSLWTLQLHCPRGSRNNVNPCRIPVQHKRRKDLFHFSNGPVVKQEELFRCFKSVIVIWQLSFPFSSHNPFYGVETLLKFWLTWASILCYKGDFNHAFSQWLLQQP